MKNFTDLIFDSFAFKIYEYALKFWNYINESVVKLWYLSHTYNFFSAPARYLSKKIPASTIKFRPEFLGIALAVILLVPSSIWRNFYAIPIFLAASVMFLSHRAATRSGGNFVTAMSVVVLVMIVCAMTVPYLVLRPLMYLALAIAFFFLVSFGLDSEEDIYSFLCPIYLLTIVLSLFALVQSAGSSARGVSATLSSSIAFAELIVIFTPFCLVFANMQKSKIRANIYAAIVLIVSFGAIMSTYPNDGIWTYAIAISIFVIIADRRWTPLLLLFFPAIWLGVFRQIFEFWQNHLHDQNLLEAIYYAGTNIWHSSGGVASNEFMSAYSNISGSSASQAALELPYMPIPTSYLKILTEAGAVILFAFLWYTIRLAHSCLIAIFRPNDDRKMLFVAGFSVLLAISVSGIFEHTLFEPRILIPYWSMLGLIAVNKRIKLNLHLTN